MQAKDIPDAEILAVIDAVKKARNMWTSRWDIGRAHPDYPEKVILAKCRSMIKRKVITGCACGCRGDFERSS